MFLISAGTMYSQSFEWFRTPEINLNLNPDMVGYTTTADAQGNVYLVGYKDTPYVYSDIMGHLYYNKYNSDGDLVFTKVITGKATSYNMIADSQGNIIVALGYVNELAIDDLEFTNVNQGMQWVMVKFNPEGTVIGHQELYLEHEGMPGINAVADFRALAVDASDAFYLGYDSYNNSYISKYSAEGELLFTIQQDEVNRLTSVTTDTEGNIYAAGSCISINSQFAGVAVDIPLDFFYSTYVVKYSPEGEYQWVKFIEDITCPSPQVVAHTPDEVYFSSHLFDAYSFDDITTEGPNNLFGDFFIAKLNTEGEFQWVREVMGSGTATQGYRNFLDIDDEGNIYFTGITTQTVNWGNGISTTPAGMGIDGLVLKYNPEGTVVMAKTAGGTSYDRFDGVTVNGNGDIFVTGMGYGNIAFDELTHETEAEAYYPFIAKISYGTLGNNDDFEGLTPVLYPNPALQSFIIANASGRGVITNMLGQKVMEVNLTDRAEVDIQDLASGTYFITLEGYKAIKFIKI